MKRLSTSEIITQSLLANDVDTVFGVPGAQIYGLFDAFAQADQDLSVIHARHEQACAYMAFGYARSSNKAGVYAVVPGPGVLNTTAALCTAYGCNLPVLGLTGQVPSGFIGKGRGHLHELPDQLSTLRTLTKWAERIDHPNEAGTIMADAFRHMYSGRPGPVAVETPWDVFEKSANAFPIEAATADPFIEPDEDAVASMADLIAGARHPMIFVGGGAINAQAQVAQLAERLKAPVVAFRSGRGIMPEDSELSASIVTAYKLWQETDLLIGIGTRLEVPYFRWPYQPQNLKLARIDIDPQEMVRMRPDAGLVSDSRMGLSAILNVLEQRDVSADSRLDALAAAKAKARDDISKIEPYAAYLEAIRKVLPRNGLFVEELCQAGYTSYYGFPIYEPRTYISSGYQGTLGFGFMTALGAKVANPDKPVISISGDGGFMFGVQELATAAQHNIGVISIVFDNGAYGNVRRDQTMRYDGRVIGAELSNPDFVKLGESFGVASYRVNTADALIPVLERAIEDDRPALIHIPIDPQTEISPWGLVHPPPPEGIKDASQI